MLLLAAEYKRPTCLTTTACDRDLLDKRREGAGGDPVGARACRRRRGPRQRNDRATEGGGRSAGDVDAAWYRHLNRERHGRKARRVYGGPAGIRPIVAIHQSLQGRSACRESARRDFYAVSNRRNKIPARLDSVIDERRAAGCRAIVVLAYLQHLDQRNETLGPKAGGFFLFFLTEVVAESGA